MQRNTFERSRSEARIECLSGTPHSWGSNRERLATNARGGPALEVDQQNNGKSVSSVFNAKGDART